MQCRADGQPFVSGRRLDPGSPKWGLMKELAVGDAVQRTASGHHQILDRHTLMQLLQQMKENFLETMLHGISKVHVTLRDFGVWLAGFAEEVHHAVGKMPCQPDRSVSLNLHALVAPQGHEVT